MTVKTFKLVHAEARSRAMQSVKDAPEGYVVKVQPATRSLDQNALLHSVLTECGDAIGWLFNGQKVDLDDLKTIFMAAYRKTQNQDVRLIVGIDGQPVIMNWRTRDLTKKECSELVDMIQAWLCEIKR